MSQNLRNQQVVVEKPRSQSPIHQTTNYINILANSGNEFGKGGRHHEPIQKSSETKLNETIYNSKLERVVRIQALTDLTANDESTKSGDIEEAQKKTKSAADAAAELFKSHPYHYRQNPFYYGTWIEPRPQAVIIYKEDPCPAIWVYWCFFSWLIIFFVAAALTVAYKNS